MKKLLLLTLLLSTLIMPSCDDEFDLNGCSATTIRFSCTSSNPYDLWIDNIYRTRLAGSTFVEYELAEGYHTWRVKQVSGYVLFPTERQGDLNVVCTQLGVSFP